MPRQFVAYGPSHWGVLALFALGVVALVWLGRRQTDAQARCLGRVLGAVTGAMYLAIQIYSWMTPSLGFSLPLHLTDLATIVGAYAFWSQRHWAYVLTYYWGLVLSTQALITPALNGPDFPSLEFTAFWSIHILVVWAAIYLTWGRGMRPTWRSYRFTVVVTLAWVAFTFTFNRIADTNYGFLNGKPGTGSLLDYLGPWPWYVLVEIALVLTVWALMTWPWERAAATRSAGRFPSSENH